jgi:FkbM family methyltransferase
MKTLNNVGTDTLLKSVELICRDWPAPNPYERLNLSDAVYAYRILLGRNPDLQQELSHLIWLSQSKSLKEFLSELLSSKEFQTLTGFIPSNHVLMAELDDFRFWFNTSDTEMGVRMGMGLYEPETVNFFRQVIKPGMTCWDIGAQTGFMTCLFAKLAGSTGRVFAYEPLPRSFEMIKRNIRENSFDSIVVVKNVACSDKHGHIPMTVASDMLIADKTSVDAKPIECVRLDEENLPTPDLIKIDVEGHEPAVISGLENVLSKCSPTIVLELNEYWLTHNSGSCGASVIKTLNELGFVVSRMEESEREIDWREFKQDKLGNCNVVAKREKTDRH